MTKEDYMFLVDRLLEEGVTPEVWKILKKIILEHDGGDSDRLVMAYETYDDDVKYEWRYMTDEEWQNLHKQIIDDVLCNGPSIKLPTREELQKWPWKKIQRLESAIQEFEANIIND